MLGIAQSKDCAMRGEQAEAWQPSGSVRVRGRGCNLGGSVRGSKTDCKPLQDERVQERIAIFI